MNDFTKEELELLKDCINYAAGNPHCPTYDTVFPLYEKIKSMIDNYCENELFMENIIDLNARRSAIAEVCGRCAHADFCVVDDFKLGHIVVCPNCGAAIGRLVFNEMNDFTKEELEQLTQWAKNIYCLDPTAFEVNLYNKIKSMIDNYCEHEKTYEDSALLDFCKNCHKVINP